MEYNVASADVGQMSAAQRRQLFFIGFGMYGAVLFIDLAFLVTFESSPTKFAAVRILAPALTVVCTIADTWLMRSVCKKQYPNHPELLEKWPLSVPEYPAWIFSACIVLSYATSAYLISRL
jgi:hypothetical protein